MSDIDEKWRDWWDHLCWAMFRAGTHDRALTTAAKALADMPVQIDRAASMSATQTKDGVLIRVTAPRRALYAEEPRTGCWVFQRSAAPAPHPGDGALPPELAAPPEGNPHGVIRDAASPEPAASPAWEALVARLEAADADALDQVTRCMVGRVVALNGAPGKPVTVLEVDAHHLTAQVAWWSRAGLDITWMPAAALTDARPTKHDF